MSGGQYQGSQAFAHIDPAHAESVNPNTGSLDYTSPLVKLRGVQPGIDLTLDLFYSAGSPGTFGLPKNWGLDLPYVLNGKSLTVGRRTFAIDPDWTTSTGHEPGLRYMNHSGIKFSKVWPALPLPSGLPGLYGYQLQRVDGTTDFFDEHGKPLEHRDMFGNFVYFSYDGRGASHGADYRELKIDYIQDSWGQRIRFTYVEGLEMQVNFPSGDSINITLSEEGVTLIEDPEKQRTAFDYAPFDASGRQRLLSSITYPNGLTSRYDYGQVEYLAEDGSGRSMPAVQSHFYQSPQDEFLSKLEYRYGETSLQTYTGASIGVRMFGASDNLMDGDGRALDYRYDVSKYAYEDADTQSTKIVTWFNNFHLPVEEIKYLRGDDGSFVEAVKTVYSYNIDVDTRARTASYSQPVRTETLRNVGGVSPAYEPLTLVESEYNEYTNRVSSSEQLHVPGKGYVTQTRTINTYMTTPVGTQILIQSVKVDEIAQEEQRIDNTPTEDRKQIASTTLSFRAGAGPVVPGRLRSFRYDTSGRRIGETVTWSPGANVPEGSVASATNECTYNFQDGILSVIEKDAAGNATVKKHDVRKNSAPLISRTLPLGQMNTFEYDRLGRRTKHTDPMGCQTITAYTVGPAGSTEQVTSPSGYVKLVKTDLLGREVETWDNGDPTKAVSPEPTRLLEAVSYDWLARVRQTTDHLGLKTSHTYDALSRAITTTDSSGNVYGHAYDDVSLKTTQTINGDVRSVTQLDGRSKATLVVTYPDSDDTHAPYHLLEEMQYNGRGEVTATTYSQQPKDGSAPPTVVQRDEIQFGAEAAVISTTTTGYTAKGEDSVKRSSVLDLFGNKYTWTKETSYADGRRFTRHGPVEIYDESNRLVLTRNRLSQEETSVYDENGWLSKTVRHDGSEVHYVCDAMGQTVETRYPSSTSQTVYNSDGRIVEVRQGSDVVKYDMAIDGTLTKVTYADGRSASFRLDQFSRPVEETDVFGVTRETRFDASSGQISSRSCNGDTIKYDYGALNHTNGQNTGFTLSGARSYRKTTALDGFGRLVQTTVADATAGTYLDTNYVLDSRGKVLSIKSSSQVSAKSNTERTFVYDGVGQLVSDTQTHQAAGGTTTMTTTTTTQYQYDGNSNVVARETDGQAVQMTYNDIDQRTDGGFEYDANGRLTRDDAGQTYVFDDQDRLLKVDNLASGAKTSAFSYRADGYLAERQGGSNDDGDTTQLYYTSGRLTAMQEQQQQPLSLFSDPASQHMIATYPATAGDEPGTYFMDQQGSTALTVQGTRASPWDYDAYGAPQQRQQEEGEEAEQLQRATHLGFAQEPADKATALIYLRTRHYSPHLMHFLTPDPSPTENRYAYCQGDPVNRHDPSGRSWKSKDTPSAALPLTAGIIGGLVGGLVSFGVGTGVGAALGAGLVASISAAVIGGAAGGVVADAVAAGIVGREYGSSQAWRSALVGGIVGALGFGALRAMESGVELAGPVSLWVRARCGVEAGASGGPWAYKLAGSAVGQWGVAKAVDKSVSSAVEGGAQAVLQPLFFGEPLDGTHLVLGFAKGFAKGMALGYLKGRWSGGPPGTAEQLGSYSARFNARAGAVWNRMCPEGLAKRVFPFLGDISVMVL